MYWNGRTPQEEGGLPSFSKILGRVLVIRSRLATDQFIVPPSTCYDSESLSKVPAPAAELYTTQCGVEPALDHIHFPRHAL